ncbi:MAG: hypothetical protein KF901_24780 [Myxococcales bacterium]|nr:hypothetical protein [Myxococcales bacterium]
MSEPAQAMPATPGGAVAETEPDATPAGREPSVRLQTSAESTTTRPKVAETRSARVVTTSAVTSRATPAESTEAALAAQAPQATAEPDSTALAAPTPQASAERESTALAAQEPGAAPAEPAEVRAPAAREAPTTPAEPTSPTEVGADVASAMTARGRYRIVEREGRRFVVSGNAPNVELHVERGLSIDGGSRKRYGARAIFLDGVYTGAPFCDNEARQYSLDHHAGCVRTFTLATCEQATVMLLQGLPLSSGAWTLWVNDPDLDSMLAAWVLMNHVELLRDDRALLRRAMPAIRLEGVIDAHGTDREILAALPDDALAAAKAQLERLMAIERELKATRRWMEVDWVEYAREQLERMDAELMPDSAVDALLELQEVGRAALFNDRIAVLIESTLGIYEVEERLKERYGATLGVIALRTGEHRYTLRLVDAFLPRNLEAVYKALNRVDPKADARATSPNLWGGSGDIGGAPRDTGTGLGGQEILNVLADVLGPRIPWWRRLWTALLTRLRGKRPALPPPRAR